MTDANSRRAFIVLALVAAFMAGIDMLVTLAARAGRKVELAFS